jgi:hypothetical protein
MLFKCMCTLERRVRPSSGATQLKENPYGSVGISSPVKKSPETVQWASAKSNDPSANATQVFMKDENSATHVQTQSSGPESRPLSDKYNISYKTNQAIVRGPGCDASTPGKLL